MIAPGPCPAASAARQIAAVVHGKTRVKSARRRYQLAQAVNRDGQPCDTTCHDDAALQLERAGPVGLRCTQPDVMDARPIDLGVEAFLQRATAGGYTDEVYRKVYCGRCFPRSI